MTIGMIAAAIVAATACGETLSERFARIRLVADGICSVTNVTVCSGKGIKETDPLAAKFSSIDEKEIKSSNACVRVDFVLKPEPGSDIRCCAVLPMPEQWDGRFWGKGNSGYAGAIPTQGLMNFAASGTASASTDLGTWAYTECGKSNKLIWPKCVCRDYDWRATHLMTVYGKRLVEAFYGRKPDKSYFHGGSCGGRQAFSEMLRFPADYDGVIASLPGNNAISKELDIFALSKQVHDENGKLLFTPAEMKIVADAAVKYMATRDAPPYAGHYLSNPFWGEKDIEGFLAVAAEMAPRLADPDLQKRLKTIYLGWTHKGRRVTHGELPGAYVGKQMTWRGITYLPQFLTKHGLTMQTATWDDMDDFVREYGPAYNSCSTDFDAFRKRGGKLIVTVALEDQTVPAPAQISHFERTVRRYGGDLAEVQGFYRLFCIPGCSHGGGKGRATFSPGGPEMWKAIVDWHEKGVAPNRIFALLRNKRGKLPIAVYPQYLVQDANGKWKAADFDRNAVREPDPFYLQTQTTGFDLPLAGSR